MSVATPTPRRVTSLAPAHSRRTDAAWLAAALLGFALLCVLLRRFITDDAWITARYAENLAAGHGFVFNPGGPRVEGFSNPALVALEAAAARAGLPAIDAARVVGVGSGLALLVAIDRLGRPVVGAAAARVALLLTALYAPIAFWALGGLETLPVALALTCGVLLACRRRALAAGAALAVLPWLRPEGGAVALAVALAAEGPGLVRGGERAAAARRLALTGGIPLLSQALLEALRLALYGHWLPNSVLYKAGGGEALAVLRRFLVQGSGALLLVAAACGALVARGRARLLALPVLVYGVGAVGMRDSVNGFSRFLLPVWPALALLAGLAVATAYRRTPRAPALAATGLLALVWVHSALTTGAEVRKAASHYVACPTAARLDAARWLREQTPPAASFTLADVGLVAARAGGRSVYDELWLNEAAIQHGGQQPAWRRALLGIARRPDVLVLASRSPERLQPRYPVDRFVTRNPGFRAYRLAHVARGSGASCRYHLFLYRRA